MEKNTEPKTWIHAVKSARPKGEPPGKYYTIAIIESAKEPKSIRDTQSQKVIFTEGPICNVPSWGYYVQDVYHNAVERFNPDSQTAAVDRLLF